MEMNLLYRKILSALMIISLLLGMFCTSAFAADITEINPKLPDVEIRVKTDIGKFKSGSKDKVKVTLDGKELTVNSAEIEDNNTISYYIFLDTSISTNTYFQSEKDAILEFYKSKGAKDKLVLYRFDETVKQILTGQETYEQAKKKVDAVKCDGQDTVLYDSLAKLVSQSNGSETDETYCILFTDGVDTLSKTKEEEIREKLKDAKHPIVGFYPDKNKEENSKKLNDLLSLTGGKASAFSSGDAAEKLKAMNPKVSESIIIKATATEGIEANEAAEVTVDLGDGKLLKANTSIEESWGMETTTEETSAEVTSEPETATPPEEETDKMMILGPVVIVVLVIALIGVILLNKKKKKADDDDDEDDEDDEIDEEFTTYYTENERDESVPFTETHKEEQQVNKPKQNNAKGKGNDKKSKKSKEEEKAQQQFQFYFEDKNKKE